MKKELQEWVNGMLVSVQNAVDRMDAGTLSTKDKNELGVFLIQLGQQLKKDPEYEEDAERLDSLSEKLMECFESLMADDALKLQENKDELRQIYMFGSVVITKADYEKYMPREDGRTYIDLSNLPRMPREQFNEYVNNLKALGAKFDRELKQWYVEKDWTPLTNETTAETLSEPTGQEEKQIEKSTEEKESAVSEEVQMKAIFYVNGNREEIYAPSKEEVLKAVKEAQTIELKGNERCYIQKYNKQPDSYQQEGIYLIASGKDITPVELKLPYMTESTFHEVKDNIKEMGAKFNVQKKMWYIERAVGQETIDAIQGYINKHDEAIYLHLPATGKEAFKQIVAQIKQDGAKYNSDKKAWYITEQMDKSKFTNYLKDQKKESVKAKILQYKSEVEKKNPGNVREMESLSHECGER